MKKILVVLLAATLFASASAVGASAWIGDTYENEEVALASVMSEMTEMAGVEFDDYTYKRTSLYNLDGTLGGYCYDVTMDTGERANILMRKFDDGENTWFEVTEIGVGEYSLYYGKSGVNLYPAATVYINYEDGVYTDLGSGEEVTPDEIQRAEEVGYGGTELYFEDWEDTVNYTYKNKSVRELPTKTLPIFTGPTSAVGACGNVAGGVVLAYWDIDFPNLIPNYECRISNGHYSWSDNQIITALMDDLYNRMYTNVNKSGTSVQDFKAGMTSYIEEHGYYVSFDSTMSGGTYSLSKISNQLLLNHAPVVLFMDNYNHGVLFEEDGDDLFLGTDYAGKHIMVAYSVVKYTYLNENGETIATRSYLGVNPCSSFVYDTQFFNLDRARFNLDDCFTVKLLYD